MFDGDIFTDSRGASWVLDTPLGRGLWGRARVVRNEDGQHAVLKTPLNEADFGDHPEAAALADACRRAATETLKLYQGEGRSCHAKVLATVPLDEEGTLGLLLPRYPATLESRLSGGLPLAEAIDIILRTLHRLAMASASQPFAHGNLRPTNILLDDEGTPFLSDPLVAPLTPWLTQLTQAVPDRATYLPPERLSSSVDASPHPPASPMHDTWACCATLFRACMMAGRGENEASFEMPQEGLGRVLLATVRDAAAGRLRAEKINPRFSSRAVDALGRILNRGLSLPSQPSPPYRFERSADLRDRLVEVDELMHPQLTHVGVLQPGAESRLGVFEGGERVTFSVNIAATRGVQPEQDIVPGIAIVDLDSPDEERVALSSTRFRVHAYPTGRFQFRFELLDVPPGRYELRVAFGIRDAQDTLSKVSRSFEVRPKPGYVPTRAEPTTSEVIPLPSGLHRSSAAPAERLPPPSPRDPPAGKPAATSSPPPALTSTRPADEAPQEAPGSPAAPPVSEPAANTNVQPLRPHLVPPLDAFPTERPRTPRPVAPPRTTSPGPDTSPNPSIAPGPSIARGGSGSAPVQPAVRVPTAAPPAATTREATPSVRLPPSTPKNVGAAAPEPPHGAPRIRLSPPPSGMTGPSTATAPRPPASEPVSHLPSDLGFADPLQDDLYDDGRDLPQYDGSVGSPLQAVRPLYDQLRAWVSRDPYTFILVLFVLGLASTAGVAFLLSS